MKNKFYLFMIISIVFISFGFYQINRPDEEEIKQNTEVGTLSPIKWYSMISTSINEKDLEVVVDNEYMDDYFGDAVMDENLSINIPYESAKELFDCSVLLYNNKKLVLRRDGKEVTAKVSKDYFKLDGKKIELDNKLYYDDSNHLYVPLELYEKAFLYESRWDDNNNTIILTCKNTDERKLPDKYCLLDDERLKNEARDQSLYGTCWAFAGIGALETSLLPEENYDFSEDHASVNNVYGRDQGDGGQYTILWSYLASWKGPVLEKDDPYGDGKTRKKLKSIKHVQEMQIIPSKDTEKIKDAVYRYGGVQSSLYISMEHLNEDNEYYNSIACSYCYKGTSKSNHDVYIIGWDDNFPKEKFNSNVKSDGAFICRNSWGSSFGDNGNFYVSYEDANIGTYNEVYTKVEDNDNFDNIYEYDECGWCGTLGFTHSEEAFAANVYTAKSDEVLKAVSFYATVPNTEYELYICPEFKGTASLLDGQQICKKGKIKNSGYYTIRCEDADLKAGSKYAVVMKIKTPDSTKPIAVECTNDLVDKVVKLNEGEGYYSIDGIKWESAEDSECNICLKAFTDDKEN